MLKKLKELVINHKNVFIIFAIFLVALILRIYHLDRLPFNFHEDEILSGYVGRFILLHGKDIYGNPWPFLYFNKFGDYYIVLPMYLSGLSTFIFGVNEFAVRFPTAFFGALAVFPIFYLTKLIFNKNVGFLSAFFLAILPWHINLSRTTAEGIIGSTIFLTATTFILWSVKNNRIKLLLFSLPFFLISYLIYHPFRIYTPLIFLTTSIVFFPVLKKNNKLFIYFLLTGFFCFLTLYILLTPWGSGRLMQTSIFNNLSGVAIRNQEAIFQEGNNNILIARIFHNKLIGYSREFLYQYLSYFSPIVLFLRGGNSPRFAMPEQGLIYLSFFILIISIFIPIKNNIKVDSKSIIFLILLLLMSPLPAALTIIDSPNIHRTVFMSIPIVIFSAFGFYRLSKLPILKIVVIPIVIIIVTIESIFFIHQYSIHSNLYDSLVRNDGQKQLIQYISKNKTKYEKIVLPSYGTMALYYLFFNNDFNLKYIDEFKYDAKLEKIDNITFVNDGCTTTLNINNLNIKNSSLFVDSPNCQQPSFKLIDSIYGINPLIPFKLYQYK